MRRTAMVSVVLILAAAALVVWVMRNTYWEDVTIPLPLQGEARINPFYAAQRFAEALGARTAWDRVLTVPEPDAVMVMSNWHWGRSARQREAIRHWVEAGGRLVVDFSVGGGDFERWSGIVSEDFETKEEPADDAAAATDAEPELCHKVQETSGAAARAAPGESTNERTRLVCDFDLGTTLSTKGEISWSLGDGTCVQALRVRRGRGSVTVINGMPFDRRSLFDGDHAWLFVAATELRRGDMVHFLSEGEHPSLLALLWHHAASVVVLALTLVGLGLWRGAVRLGPLAAPPLQGRRSLAEQIRGTGLFALRHGGGESLHAASVRALEESAARRVSGYARLSVGERAAAIARLTGFERDALAKAIYHPGLRHPHELRSTIALVETARRRLIIDQTRTSYDSE